MSALRFAPTAFVALLVLGVAVPFIPIIGPLSADDLLPLIAVAIAAPVVALRRRDIRFPRVGAGLLALVAVGAVSSAANAVDLGSYLRLLGRSSGRAAFYLAVIVACHALLRDRTHARRAVWALVAVATAEALFSVASVALNYRGPYGIGAQDFAKTSPLFGMARAQGTFGAVPGRYEAAAHSANFLAAYLVMSALLTMGAAIVEKGRVRTTLAACAVLQVVALYLTYTRAALAALGAGVIALGLLSGKRRAAAAVLVLGISVALAVPSIRTKLFRSHNRYALYTAAVKIAADNPLFGVGDGRYEEVLFSDARYMNSRFGRAAATAHNSILQSTAHHGVFGGLANVLLYALAALALARARRSGEPYVVPLAAALVAFVVNDQSNNLLYVPKVATQAFFILGVATCFDREKS